MKAAVLRAQDQIIIEDLPEPVPGPDDVVVRVRAAGVCGSDVPRVLSGSAHHYPIVLGHEFSGDIAAVGGNVKSVKPGDRVAGAPLIPCGKCGDCACGYFSQCKRYSFIGSRVNGAFAEYVVIPAQNAVLLEDNVTYTQGAFFEPATVGIHGIFISGYSGGDDVAVIGGGNIGIFTMMWAKIMGARSVTVIDIDERRLKRAEAFGADHIINSSVSTDGVGKAPHVRFPAHFSAVFETAGTPETIHMAFELAGSRARVCCIGTPARDFGFGWKLWELMNRKEFVLTGSWMSYSAPFPGREWQMTASCFSDGRLLADDRLIYKRIKLEELPDAFELYKKPGEVNGKIMVDMN